MPRKDSIGDNAWRVNGVSKNSLIASSRTLDAISADNIKLRYALNRHLSVTCSMGIIAREGARVKKNYGVQKAQGV